jgi:sugar phosphate isomerase/epimerase
MRFEYFRGMWGMEERTVADNLRKIKEGGFDGVEMTLPDDPAQRREIRAILDDLDLDLIVQFGTTGASPEEHGDSFEKNYRKGAELTPLLANSHTGRDYFSTRDNLGIFERARRWEEKLGVPVLHEIHRGRATFSATATSALIDALPDVRLTADFSHWCCVHESLLQDQEKAVERAIERSWHIHARVGHPEGPQVTDPRAPEWRGAVEAHLRWWQKIADLHSKRGTEVLPICPEFGPPGYMTTLPFTRQPLVDLWEVNCYMKDMLKERLLV